MQNDRNLECTILGKKRSAVGTVRLIEQTIDDYQFWFGVGNVPELKPDFSKDDMHALFPCSRVNFVFETGELGTAEIAQFRFSFEDGFTFHFYGLYPMNVPRNAMDLDWDPERYGRSGFPGD